MAKSNPEIWKRPLSSTPNSCSAGLAGVTRHHATPEPKLHKRATRRRKASAVFCGVGRSINLDLDLDPLLSTFWRKTLPSANASRSALCSLLMSKQSCQPIGWHYSDGLVVLMRSSTASMVKNTKRHITGCPRACGPSRRPSPRRRLR